MTETNKKYFYKTIIFITIFVILIFLSNLSYYYIVIKNTNLYKNQKQFEELYNDDLNIIFFGDSFPALAVNPEYIQNSFNYAVPGERYDQTFYKVKSVLSRKSQVKTIVLPYDTHAFSRIDSDNNRYHYIWYWSNFIPANELEKITGKSKIKLTVNKYLPFVGNGKDYITVFLLNEKTEMYKGWQKNYNTTQPVISSSQGNNGITEQIIRNDLIKSFMDTIRYAEENNKTIILIKYPNLTAAINGKEDDKSKIFYSRMDNEIKKIKNIHILDYRNFSKDNNLFSDPNHLNYRGAEIFSKKLNNDLKKAIN